MKNKFLNKLKLFGLMLGGMMKGGDDAIFGRDTSNEGSSYEKHDGSGGVFQDLLEEKVTKEVEELRDKYYRVYKESDFFDTSTITIQMNNDDESDFKFVHNGRLLKDKTKKYIKHCKVFNEIGDNVITIQDNIKFEKNGVLKNLHDYDVLLDIERDGITPRFELEKYVTKIVVRKCDDDNMSYVDLYTPYYASQFGKTDAMLIANLHEMMDNKTYRSDITDFLSFKWTSYKAWGCDDICLFKYDNIVLADINVFDGNFVLTFKCRKISEGDYIAEKYKTKELTEKYNTKAPKSDTFFMDYNNFKTKNIL